MKRSPSSLTTPTTLAALAVVTALVLAASTVPVAVRGRRGGATEGAGRACSSSSSHRPTAPFERPRRATSASARRRHAWTSSRSTRTRASTPSSPSTGRAPTLSTPSRTTSPPRPCSRHPTTRRTPRSGHSRRPRPSAAGRSSPVRTAFGGGATIGIVDTGVDLAHPDLASQLDTRERGELRQRERNVCAGLGSRRCGPRHAHGRHRGGCREQRLRRRRNRLLVPRSACQDAQRRRWRQLCRVRERDSVGGPARRPRDQPQPRRLPLLADALRRGQDRDGELPRARRRGRRQRAATSCLLYPAALPGRNRRGRDERKRPRRAVVELRLTVSSRRRPASRSTRRTHRARLRPCPARRWRPGRRRACRAPVRPGPLADT